MRKLESPVNWSAGNHRAKLRAPMETHLRPEPKSARVSSGLVRWRGACLEFALVATSSYIAGMTSVGIRNLKNQLSHYVRRVAAGDRVQVTDRGRIVAELVPPSGSSAADTMSRYEALVAAGVVRPALEDGDPLADMPVLRLPRGTAAALIDEDRVEPQAARTSDIRDGAAGDMVHRVERASCGVPGGRRGGQTSDTGQGAPHHLGADTGRSASRRAARAVVRSPND